MSLGDPRVTTCADCGKQAGHGDAFFVMTSPKGPWALCSGCVRLRDRDAAEQRVLRDARIAKREGKQRKTHLKARVGSHG